MYKQEEWEISVYGWGRKEGSDDCIDKLSKALFSE